MGLLCPCIMFYTLYRLPFILNYYTNKQNLKLPSRFIVKITLCKLRKIAVAFLTAIVRIQVYIKSCHFASFYRKVMHKRLLKYLM